MQFSMTSPCVDCPWRKDIDFYLHPARVAEILTAIFQRNETFTCHHTISGKQTRKGYSPGINDQHCAGALILIEREGIGHSMAQIAERFGLYDPGKLQMDAPVFANVEAVLERYNATAEGTALVQWLNRVRPKGTSDEF